MFLSSNKSTIFFFILFTFFSCTKRSIEGEKKLPIASIKFITPSEGQVFMTGDTVIVNAVAISTADLHGYDILLRRAGETTNLDFQHIHDHNDTINIQYKWKNVLTGSHNMEAEITVYLDHDLNFKREKVSFKVQ